MQQRAQRNLNLDLIRCVAVISVVGVHFFLHTPFYDMPVGSGGMYLLAFFRTAFMVCVPLFAMLTGYLCGHKRAGWDYLKKLLPVLLTYLLCGILILTYRNVVLDAGYTLGDALAMLVSLAAAPYGWYIGMYIGLYLLIPFLNAAYRGLSSRKEKQFLLLSLFLLTVLPGMTNQLIPYGTGFVTVAPVWWFDIWPITFFFLGAYLREYGLDLSAGKALLLLVLSLAVSTAYNCLRSQRGTFYMPYANNWGGVQNTVHAVLIFALILKLDLSRIPGWTQGFIRWISRISLALYLCSWISDQAVYRWLALPPEPKMLLLYMPVAVGLSAALAAILAQAVFWVQAGLMRLGKR